MAENNIPDLSNKLEKETNFTDKDNSIIKCWNQTVHKPKCIVFDLDYTLWPFIIDDKIAKIYKWKDEQNLIQTKILDQKNKPLNHYLDINLILKSLKEICFKDETFYLRVVIFENILSSISMMNIKIQY